MRIKKGVDPIKWRLQRFEDKIFYSPCGCWFWTASLMTGGYGAFVWDNHKQVRANRASYMIYKGDIPSGLLVCHSCDNPSCVNPDHLFLGTQQDNIIDMYSKGRGVDNSGEKNGRSKLDQLTVNRILVARNNGIKGKDIAEAFKISRPTVSSIAKGIRWNTKL